MNDNITLMERMKTCTYCGVEKPLSEFNKHRLAKDGLDHQCKTCSRARSKAFRASPSGIYTSIKGRLKFYQKKPFSISREDFIEWFESQPQECAYCGLKKEDLQLIQDRIISASSRLTVDCVDNERGYELGNLALCCMRCNYLKNDFLSSDEMHEIGPKYVRPKWDAQLNKPTAKTEGE